MPVQIRLMSWNIQKKKANASFIARLMQAHSIDICALLEVPHADSFTIPFQIITSLDNLNPGYHNTNWKSRAVGVGDETVVYIWHQTNNVGPNAFRASEFTNLPGMEISGKVMQNAAEATIYFPTTGFLWTSLPGKPDGRRPAYMAFETNDGNAIRRFTFLDIHTPFNKDTFIQSWSTHIYASTREIQHVETLHAATAASNAKAASIAFLATPVDPLLAGVLTLVTPLALRDAAVTRALAIIEETIQALGTNQAHMLGPAMEEAVTAAIGTIGDIQVISDANIVAMARACAMAGAVGTLIMVASMALPTAPFAAVGSVNATALVAQGIVTNAVSNAKKNLRSRSSTEIKGWVVDEAVRIGRLALAPFTFATLPSQVVDMAVIAGDFNVHYPDGTGYLPVQQAKLGSTNAYAALIAATTGARNSATSTRVGPTAYKANRIFELRNPSPIQHTNSALTSYVPLDVTSMAGNSYMGSDNLTNALKSLARTQHVVFAQLEQSPYVDRLLEAFSIGVYNGTPQYLVINDTSFYRANCYDNMFVRGGTFVRGGMIDVMSELGSWGLPMAPFPNPVPNLTQNPWPAATATLNPIAQTQLTTNPTLTFDYSTSTQTFTYDITVALADAEEAAVFFDQFISDHLPVYVEVRV
jgi:hypothetical protein